MPIRIFECGSCKKKLELIQLGSEKLERPICVNEFCGNREMETVIGVTNFSLKGSGWARDGYSKR